MTFCNKIPNDNKKKRNHKKWSGSKINNIIIKRIKEYPKATHHREKWLWTKNSI